MRLNEEVKAETDEQFGFVRNPVANNTLKVKFPRDDVENVLDVGEEVRVTVSGETDTGQLLVGTDYTRVIDMPGHKEPDLGCPLG